MSLVVPLPAAFTVAAGFAAGRWTMPVLSNAWSDDGGWTELWSSAERVVRVRGQRADRPRPA